MPGNTYAAYLQQRNRKDALALQVAELFDAARRHIVRAQSAIEAQKWEDSFNETEEVAKILEGLRGSLVETSETKDVCQRMHDYYTNMIHLTRRANTQQRPDICTELKKSFTEMANTWREIHKLNGEATGNGENAPERASAAGGNSRYMQDI